MKRALLVFLLSFVFPLCAHCAESGLSPDALLLAEWITHHQYLDAHLPSYGALRTESGVAANTTNGAYCGVSPYFADLAVLSLFRVQAPGAAEVGGRWIDWYFTHLNPQSAPEGVPYEQFYHPDGTGETVCAKPGDPTLCRNNDATDSAAATFFSVLWAASGADRPSSSAKLVARKQSVENLAAVLLKLQQPDGLCWAKTDYRVKYLEDNCEVYAGLRDLARLEQEFFHDSERSNFYERAADRVRQGIFDQLYDSHAHLFRIAEFEQGDSPAVNLDKWYPDTQAQYWPVLFGLLARTNSQTAAIISAIDHHWNGRPKPDWAAHPDQINSGWIESGSAYGAWLAGDVERIRIYVPSAKRLKFPKSGSLEFHPPFSIADAGWLLQLLVESSGEN